MGNGTKFKLSNVLPSVFSKIKGIGPRRNGGSSKQKAGSSVAALSDYASSDHIDPSDFSGPSKHSLRGERSLSPVRVFPQRRETRDMVGYSSSPVPGQKTYDIRFPMESPVRSSKSRSHSPHSPPTGAAQFRMRSTSTGQPDPGCCSFDSTMALAPQIDGRMRKAVPQALRACSIMSKCNSFNGSTHSDSELSETDASTTRGQDSLRHSRVRSVHLDGSSWSEGHVLAGRNGGSSRRLADGPGSARERRSLDLRDRKSKAGDRHQLYGGSSPTHPVASSNSFDGSANSPAAHARHCAADRECRGASAWASNSTREELIDRELELRARGGRTHPHRLTRNRSCTSEDSSCRPFDETFSSDDQLHKGRRSSSTKDNVATMRRSRSRSASTPARTPVEKSLQSSNQSKTQNQQQQHQRTKSKSRGSGRSEDLDPGYASSTSEVLLTEDERNHAAILRREAVLARTVLNASDGWARLQLSRFSRTESPGRRKRLPEDETHGEKENGDGDDAAVLASANDWAMENLRALAKVNGADREAVLARLNAGHHLDRILVNSDDDGGGAAEKIGGEYAGFGLGAPDSRARGFSKSSRNLSPLGKVEKLVEGENFDARKSSVGANDAYHTKEMAGGDVEYEGFLPLVGYASRLGRSNRTEKSDKEIGTPWDTEFPSFRSDSMLLEGGKMGLGRSASSEDRSRGGLLDISESHALASSRTPRYLERQRQTKIRLQGQRQDQFRSGRTYSRSPSPREELADPASRNSKVSINYFLSGRQSHELGARPGGNKLGSSPSMLSSVPEIDNCKKMSARVGSPTKTHDSNGRRSSSQRALSPLRDFQKGSETQQQGKRAGRAPSPAREQSTRTAAAAEVENLDSIAEAGMQRLDSVAVVKASYDPYQDFRESMVEMILENDIRTTEDLEDLLQCYLSLNSSDYHKIIVQVFTDIWGEIFQ